MLLKNLAELGRAAGWHAGLAFAGLAGVIAAIPAAANANLPAPRPVPVLVRPAAAKPAAAPATPPPPEFAFAEPLPGHDIGSPFGLRELPWEPHARLHEGVDIPAPTGEEVHATLPGRVVRAGVSDSYGRFVEVEHAGGLTSFYAHLSAAARHMRPGREIAASDVVGYVGDSGHSTGPHLHFEIRRDGAPLNPAMFIDRQFATAANLPLRQAEAVGRVVRIAQVSATPRAFRAEHIRLRGRIHAVIEEPAAPTAPAAAPTPAQAASAPPAPAAVTQTPVATGG